MSFCEIFLFIIIWLFHTPVWLRICCNLIEMCEGRKVLINRKEQAKIESTIIKKCVNMYRCMTAKSCRLSFALQTVV